MSIFWFVAGMVACLFLPSPISAWSRDMMKKLWNKIFKKREDVAV